MKLTILVGILAPMALADIGRSFRHGWKHNIQDPIVHKVEEVGKNFCADQLRPQLVKMLTGALGDGTEATARKNSGQLRMVANTTNPVKTLEWVVNNHVIEIDRLKDMLAGMADMLDFVADNVLKN
jgi:hypothetical protein